MPKVLAGRMRIKHAALVQALTGRFDEHHAELARMLLDSYDALTGQIDRLSVRIDELISQLPAAAAPTPDDRDDNRAPTGEVPLPVIARLDEIPGIAPRAARIIIATIGLDTTRFPTANHLVSWAKLSPRTIQSGPRSRGGKTGKGNPYLKGALGEVATAAAKTNIFLGARYKRVVKRRGKLKPLVAVARSILVIIWHLLADPTSRYHDLRASYHNDRLSIQRRTRSHVQQLPALGYEVTLTAAS